MACRGCGQRRTAEIAQQMANNNVYGTQALTGAQSPLGAQGTQIGPTEVVIEYVGIKMAPFTVVGARSKRAYMFGTSPANRYNIVPREDAPALLASPEFRICTQPVTVVDRKIEIGMNNPRAGAMGLAGPRIG